MKAAAITDRGLLRPNNEDTVFSSTTKVGKLPNLFVVADGMGGANAGEYASDFVIKDLVASIKKNISGRTHLSIMRDAIEHANRELFKDARRNHDHDGCGTTLVTAMIEDGTLYVSNVGDSRLYIITDKIVQITRDHSYVEYMVQSGRMTRGSEDYLKKRNLITRAIGIEGEVEIDFFDEALNGDEIILLCTDGLSTMLDDADIMRIVKESTDIEKAAAQLIEAANEKGGDDNISVVLVSELDKR